MWIRKTHAYRVYALIVGWLPVETDTFLQNVVEGLARRPSKCKAFTSTHKVKTCAERRGCYAGYTFPSIILISSSVNSCSSYTNNLFAFLNCWY
ncbi:hypothetical protein FHS56_001064 [Thermonema lapsum]|uniref:Uncharacterized protein n=1 Tax=Thermonema lapsum TaxID=28195 RepID=A0A846MPQ0_9BACT|nr:hypothetical protein [Thermonema lapsum]